MKGAQAAPYQLMEELGHGGMATVYRAYQPAMDRYVAIKLIKPDYIKHNPDGLERFQFEVRVVSKLEHPHILPVYDFDLTHDEPYLVMRLLTGGSLRQKMAGGQLPLADIIQYMSQICKALDHAHKHEIIHRDIKPANIMLDEDNNAYVTDFGVARIRGSAGMTESGVLLGTLEYTSPEQLNSAKSVDRRTDIYALGIMLFEMATGSVPFRGSPQETITAHFMRNAPSVASVRRSLPAGFDDIIQTALAKDPEQRYARSGELAAQLRALGETATAPAASAPADDEFWTQFDEQPTVTPTVTAPPPAAAPAPASLSGPAIHIAGNVGNYFNISGGTNTFNQDGRKDKDEDAQK